VIARDRLPARLFFARVKSLAIGSGRRRVGKEFLRDMESVAIGSGQRRVEGRCSGWSPWRLRSTAVGGAWRAGGFLSRSMDHTWREESPGRAGDRETRAIGLLPCRARLGIYVKFALSFAKLSKIQTPNTKPLDISFYDFWQITIMQSPNAKPLKILLRRVLTIREIQWPRRHCNLDNLIVKYPLHSNSKL